MEERIMPASATPHPTIDPVTLVLNGLEHILDVIEKRKMERVLTYSEAMDWFIRHKGDHPDIAKGAMLKKQLTKMQEITFCMLSKANNLVSSNNGRPIGLKWEVGGLDAELTSLFGDNEIIIIG
jgi:hypothetical protein